MTVSLLSHALPRFRQCVIMVVIVLGALSGCRNVDQRAVDDLLSYHRMTFPHAQEKRRVVQVAEIDSAGTPLVLLVIESENHVSIGMYDRTAARVIGYMHMQASYSKPPVICVADNRIRIGADIDFAPERLEGDLRRAAQTVHPLRYQQENMAIRHVSEQIGQELEHYADGGIEALDIPVLTSRFSERLSAEERLTGDDKGHLRFITHQDLPETISNYRVLEPVHVQVAWDLRLLPHYWEMQVPVVLAYRVEGVTCEMTVIIKARGYDQHFEKTPQLWMGDGLPRLR